MPEDFSELDKLLAEKYGTRSPDAPNSAMELAAKALSPLGNILDTLDTGLNVTVNTLRPLLVQANPKLNDLFENAPKKFNIPNVTFSDIMEASFPESIPAKVAGFALDVAGDPLTYLTGVGTLTHAGQITKAVEGAAAAKTAISADSKIGKAALKLVGGTGAKGIRTAKQTLRIGESLAEQADKGQRALVSVGIPFTGIDHPLVKGSKVFSTAEDISKLISEQKPVKAFFKMFGTSSGNPLLDKSRAEFVALGRHLTGQAKMDAVDFGRKFEAIRKGTGEDPEVLKKALIDLVENPQHGNVSAASVLEKNAPDLTQKLWQNRQDFEQVFKKMDGVQSLSAQERLKLFRGMYKNLTESQAFGNPYTLGFRQLPEEFRSTFANTVMNEAGVHMLVELGKKTNKYANFGDMLKAYTAPGKMLLGKKLSSEDAALLSLVGKKEFTRLTTMEKQAAKALEIQQKTGKVMPPAVKQILAVANEAGNMRSTIRQSLAHIDEMFALNYTMYRSNPQMLQQLNKKMFSLIDKVDKNPNWKIDGLIKQFHYPAEIAKKYPELYTLGQEMRRWFQLTMKEEQFAGVAPEEFIGNIFYNPHIPTPEIRKFFEENLGSNFAGAGRQWTVNHANQLKRSLANIDARRVEEAYNLGIISATERKGLLGKNGFDYLESKISSRSVANQKWSEEFGARFKKYLTVSQTNELAKMGKLKILNGRSFTKFFDDNPVELIRIRGQRAGRAISSAQFFEAVKPLGKMVRADSPIAPEGFSFVKADPLAGVQLMRDPATGAKIPMRLGFEPEVAKHIDAFNEALKVPIAANPFLEGFDRFQDLFKAWTLAVFPAYHIRNVVGNHWNNFLAGMNPLRFAELDSKAALVQHLKGGSVARDLPKGRLGELLSNALVHDANFTLKTKAGTKYTAQEIDKLAQKYGLINTGQYYGDVMDYLESEAKGVFKKVKAIPDAGLKVGNYFENNAKLAHFIWQLEEGMSPLDAATSVKKYLFDYRDIAPTEREIFRRVMPFYTWTRKNVPLQIEALATTPNKPLGVNKFIGSFVETNYDGVPDERNLPDWMVQNYPIRIRKNQNTGNFEYFLLGSWLPMADIDKIFNPVKFIANQLTPLLKEPIQQVANKDFYFDKAIDQGGEYERITGINLPKRVTHVLKNIRILNETDKMFFNNEGVDAYTKVLQGLTGKVYPYDEELQRQFEAKKFKDDESRLKYMLKKAMLKGDEGEANRVQRRIEKLVEEAANKS